MLAARPLPQRLLLAWVVCALGGSLLAAWSLQRDVQRAADDCFVSLRPTFPTGTTLRPEARGRSVQLTGTAFRQSDIDTASQALRSEVRLGGLAGWGIAHPVVQQVRPPLVAIAARPPGWGLLVALADRLHLEGLCATDSEGLRVATSVRVSTTREIDNALRIDPIAALESDQLDRTLDSLPPLDGRTHEQALVAFARWGKPWAVLDLDQPLERLRQQLEDAGLPLTAWNEAGSALIDEALAQRARWQTQVRDEAKRANEPHGHVILAQRGDTILLRGALGSAASCKALIDKVRILAGARHLVDQLDTSTHRRPELDMQPLISTVPGLPTSALTHQLFVGTPITGWKAIALDELDVQDESTLGADALPQGLDRRLVLPDVLSTVAWLHASDAEPQMRSITKRAAYAVLAIIGSDVVLRGLVPDEATRSLIDSSVRRHYPALSADVQIALDPECANTSELLETLATLPPVPAKNTVGTLAVVLPGLSWAARPARLDLLDPAVLEQSGLLPRGVNVAQVLPILLELEPRLQAQHQAVRSAPPGIPIQPK